MAKKSYRKKRTSPRRKIMKGGFIGGFLNSIFGGDDAAAKPTDAAAAPPKPDAPKPADAPPKPAVPVPAVPVPAANPAAECVCPPAAADAPKPPLLNQVRDKAVATLGAANAAVQGAQDNLVKKVSDTTNNLLGKKDDLLNNISNGIKGQTGGRHKRSSHKRSSHKHKHSRTCKHGGSRKHKRSSHKHSRTCKHGGSTRKRRTSRK